MPSLLLAADGAALPTSSAEQAARQHLERQRRAYGVSREALAAARVLFTHDVGRGGVLVALRQRVGGVELFDNDIKVLLDRSHRLVAISGSPHPAAVTTPLAPSAPAEAAAIAAALRDVHAMAVDPAWFVAEDTRRSDDFERFVLATGAAGGLELRRPARVKPVYFPLGDELVPAYLVEVQSSTRARPELDVHQYVIAADDARVLHRRNATAHAGFQYRAFVDAEGRPLDGPTEDYTPYPFDAPNPDDAAPEFVAPELVTMEGFNHNPDGEADPWLPADATQTRGNHVDAYVDHHDPSGLRLVDGEFRASVSAPGVFDYSYDTAAEPLADDGQSMAAIVQAFYTTNWLHDWWYDSGFTEATGAAQFDNYGRGGIDDDRMLVEVQDAVYEGKRDRASMTVPFDGESPFMELALFSPKSRTAELSVPGLGMSFMVGAAYFGPKVFDLSAELVLADDGVDTTSDGCQPLVNDVVGKIVLIDRGGGCIFVPKAETALAAGAAGVILVNNKPGEGSFTPGKEPDAPDPQIATVGLSMEDGATLKAALLMGPLIADLSGLTTPDRDSALDNLVVAHEYAHYVHHRLVATGNLQSLAQSEGWGDFFALHLALRPGDDLAGAYGHASYVSRDPGPFFGLRRYTYSTDTSKNALTFRHISDGEPLPDGTPTAPSTLPNSGVHNAGEVWATMLWEVYVALHEAHAGDLEFDAVRRRMSDYVVAGMMLAPTQPSYTEQRDAMLTAIGQHSVDDFVTAAQAFARRGAGTCAVSPPNDSTDLVGVVEDFEVRPRGAIVAASLDDTVDSCDGDGILDADESGRLTVIVRNFGAAPLTGASLTVIGAPDNLSLGPDKVIAVPEVGPLAEVEVSLDAELAAASGATPLALTLRLSTPEGCEASTDFLLPTALDADRTPTGGAVDDVEANATLWTIGGAKGEAVWSRRMSAETGTVWHAASPGTVSDTWIASPPLKVSPDQPFVVTFEHAHAFEVRIEPLTYVDGGLIEISRDGGATWQDVASHVESSPYAGPILGGLNPLFAEGGVVGFNPSYPQRDPVSLDFGTAFAGETVQLRFRVGTNPTTGGHGWDLDNFAFAGIEDGPFPQWIDDDGQCDGETPTTSGDDAGSDDSSATGEASDTSDEQPTGADGCACSLDGERGSAALSLAPLLALAALRRRRR
ncbi:M36 family metallopeptidase [Nannocystis radixulma]|uniref:M36 family metallopeptidase n=1 Tax=Nannocystis radixulma TaxID=2995305 RepID=A0ABT5AZ80_9BACT|nr:M36 family metallopeptidase [Nannocystis radixulma]MDC0666262.1 M36 family metallopeptidase [Nannocystis radixulma]